MNLVFELLTAPSRRRVSSLILTRLGEIDEELRGPQHKIYTETLWSLVEDVREIYHVRHILFWLMKLPDPIVDLLNKGDLTARLILLPYGIGLKFFKDTWFVGNIGELLCRELIDPRESVPPQWADIVESIRNEFME